MARFGFVRKLVTFGTVLTVVLAGAGLADRSAVAATVNAAPRVVPALGSWTGGTGTFAVDARTRIVIGALLLRGEAMTFQADLAEIIGRRLPISYGSARKGDIALTLRSGGDSEAYLLAIADVVTLEAGGATGISRGAQTIEQLFSLDSGHRQIPRGSADDRPRAGQRGYMLDAGRHYYQPSYIKQQIRQAAWYKLNTVHLHLTEYNAFRLNSPKFPGLAPAQSYDRSDIAGFEAVASKYHVMLIPEIDLPAHASAITTHWPGTTWDCAPMNQERGQNFTMDVTKQATRDVVKQLLDEFVPWFTGPYFHIGTDEYPYQSTQEQCPELVAYAAAHHLANTSDVMVQFIDYLNDIVRSHQKTSMIWAWWDRAGQPTLDPNHNIVIESYDYDAQHYLDKGYEVVYGNGNEFYVTPGLDLLPNDQALYEKWPWIDNSRLRGYMISRWSDNAENQVDAYQDWYAMRPLAVLADRTWGGPAAGTVLDLENQVDRIGLAPNVPGISPDATKLGGTAYGSTPSDPSDSPDKVFDGDPATFFDAAKDGAYAGIDLGAAKTVTKIRFLPRQSQPSRMTGGVFEGCTDGPASGCVPLAKVPWNPAVYDWHQLAVSQSGRFRWLRYVAPDGGYGNVSEVEFYTAPAIGVSAALSTPSQLHAFSANTTTVTLTNTASATVCGISLVLTANSIDSGVPLATTGRGTVGCLAAGRSAAVPWRVAVPIDSVPGDYRLAAVVSVAGVDVRRTNVSAISAVPLSIAASVSPSPLLVTANQAVPAKLHLVSTVAIPTLLSWKAASAAEVKVSPSSGHLVLKAGGTTDVPIKVTASGTQPGVRPVTFAVSAGPLRQTLDLPVSVPYPQLNRAFDNVGITADGAASPPTLNGGIDGDGSSLSQQALAGAGAAPGGVVSHGGVTFAWPATDPGTPDNAVANGQSILIGKAGRTLGFLTTGTYVAPGTFTGSGTVTYTDGTSKVFSFAIPEWQRAYTTPADEAITMSYHNYAPVGQISSPTHVFFTGVPLDPSRTVASVTLPAGSGGRAALHVFAIAVG